MPTVDGSATVQGLRRLSTLIREAAALTLHAAVEAAESSAKGTDLYKDQSGKTRRSVKATYSGLVGHVTARGASKFLENGTVAHTIAAKNAKMLRFYVNGSAVYRRSVRHPGTQERPVMRQARDIAMVAAEFAAEIYVNEAIARA